MVSGSSPQTQGEKLVKRPAPYMTGKDVTRLDGSLLRLNEAKLLAADSA